MINTEAPKSMSLDELIEEYRTIRGLIKEDRWVSSYATRLHDRLAQLQAYLADRFIDEHSEKTK
jgi:hypothetical protein